MHAALVVVQSVLELSGIVFGPDGKPLQGARIEVGSAETRTDAKGRFKLSIPEGATHVRITAEGMEDLERELVPGKPLLARLEAKVASAVVVVEGSGYGTEDTARSGMTRLEIYTTPGAAADVFQAAKSLPGVSNTTEGAELFVRGGKPEEVGIFINGGRLGHPFHHPSTQGGIFSSVDTAMVTSVNFIPGGFSARYGDALSAVLDLSVDNAPLKAGGELILDPGGQSAMIQQPFGQGLARASARYADTHILDQWFHLSSNFEEAPISSDMHLAYQQPMGSGRISFYALGSKDHLAVETRIANQKDTYSSRSETGFTSVNVSQAFGETLALNLDVSRTDFSSRWSFGSWGDQNWGLDQREGEVFFRGEGLWQPSATFALEAGLDGNQTRFSPRGRVPEDLANWNPGGAARQFGYDFRGDRLGGYATLRWRMNDDWGLSLGGRTDHYDLQHEQTSDLRTTLSYRASDRLTWRFSAGSFHQAPAMTAMDPYAGNPNLKTLKATHALAALEFQEDRGSLPWQARIEVYRKTYKRLLVEDPTAHYLGNGHGTATGLDLLLKASGANWHGSLGYGYLNTRRQEDKQYVEGPVPTSIPHNVTLVLTRTLSPGWELSATYRLASGAPVTPILGGLPDGTGNYLPIEGARYGDRLPTYQRTDMRLTRMFMVGPFRCVSFLEIMNLFNRANLSGYSYSTDYRERTDNPSYFSRRIVVAGVSASW
jgi:vitamin B12 transporter